jgi:predicted DNA-binding transcriptional regulator YafY
MALAADYGRNERLPLHEAAHSEFRATVSGLNEIAWWILSYIDQAEVLQPVKLRRLVAQRAQNMTAIYNGKS